MPLWSLLIWLAIGGLAGYSAGKIMGGTRPYGLVGDIVLGLVGSVVGGWLLGLFGLGGAGLIASFATALIGAVALIWIIRQIKKS